MAIRILTGVLGAGKSYKAVHDLLHRLAKGRPQYANFPLNELNVERFLRLRYRMDTKQVVKTMKNVREIRDYSDMFAMFGGEACDMTLDEAGDWFPAREHGILPPQFITYMRHSRKAEMEVTLITQLLTGLDTQIRSIAAEIFVARPAPLYARIVAFLLRQTMSPGQKLIRYVQTFDSADEEIQNKPKGVFAKMARVETVPLDYLIASCYNSKEMFPSPFDSIRAAKKPKDAELFDKLGINWDLALNNVKKHSKNAYDGLPFLTLDEVVNLLPGERVSDKLRDKMLIAELDFNPGGLTFEYDA